MNRKTTSKDLVEKGIDITPHHSMGKREDIKAAYAYVLSVVRTADTNEVYPAWHGWALREAFLAGIHHVKRSRGCRTLRDISLIIGLSKLSMSELRKKNRALERAYNGANMTKAQLIYQIAFLADAPVGLEDYLDRIFPVPRRWRGDGTHDMPGKAEKTSKTACQDDKRQKQARRKKVGKAHKPLKTKEI